ncbi:MAG: ABC transporter ATP-binding protein [Clostridia bacterium]|nr:ABC transporter ATP-binding protein [Clostridia bacterium]
MQRKNILILKNICKSFNKKKVLSDFSYSFPSNGIIAIMGPSGCGKTTLLRIIAGLEKQDRGTIEKSSDTSISYAFQEDRLFPSISALKNVECCCDDSAKARELLEKVNLSEFCDYLPAELSGGMKQRVSLARALSVNADIILLDEAFKSQDKDTREMLYKVIKGESETRLIIMVTHDITEAENLASEIISL